MKLGERPEREKLASMQGNQSREHEEELKGLAVGPLNRESRMTYRIPESVTNGVVVTGVEPGSAAQEAGLSPGDVIKEINRQQVSSVDMFAKKYKKSKDSVLLYVYRNGNHFFAVLKK